MILVFYLFSILIIIIGILCVLLLTSKFEITVKDLYFNNINKKNNNKHLKITIALAVGKVKWLWINFDKNKIEKLYVKIKKKEQKNSKKMQLIQQKIKKQIVNTLKNEDSRKDILNVKINLEKLSLNTKIATTNYPVTAYIVTAISILISNILPYITNSTKNIYYKIEPVYVPQNFYEILASFKINIKIYQIIFAIIRIKKESNGNNIIKKKEGKNYGRTSNRKFNEHSYE